MNIKMVTAGIALSLHLAAAAAADPAAPAYQPFPKGYGYLEETAALAKAVKEGDHAVVREHGWKLWMGIMQPADGLDWPVWYTWPNTTAAFAAPPAMTAGAAETRPPKRHFGRSGMTTFSPVEVKNRPHYPIPPQVIAAYPAATSQCGANTICDGAHFQSNGDIMIATESLSREGYDFIRDPKRPLYLKSTLNDLHGKGVRGISTPPAYLVTKHMYWPVKATGLTALPVWHDDFGAASRDYAGYEKWNTLVAIDPSGNDGGKSATVSFLYGILQADKQPWPTVTKDAQIHGLKEFYYHRVSQADWDSFDDADKAIINAASYWANNQPFGVGDYLVTVAMHINTKEIPSWALQSVWWSDRPDATPYAANRPAAPTASGPWKHYLLVDSYGIPEPGRPRVQPVATNPYIELVSHPVGTNCATCHARAGWPSGLPMTPEVASYQNPTCPSLRVSLNPKSPCLKSATLTDFQWIIPDRAQ